MSPKAISCIVCVHIARVRGVLFELLDACAPFVFVWNPTGSTRKHDLRREEDEPGWTTCWYKYTISQNSRLALSVTRPRSVSLSPLVSRALHRVSPRRTPILSHSKKVWSGFHPAPPRRGRRVMPVRTTQERARGDRVWLLQAPAPLPLPLSPLLIWEGSGVPQREYSRPPLRSIMPGAASSRGGQALCLLLYSNGSSKSYTLSTLLTLPTPALYQLY